MEEFSLIEYARHIKMGGSMNEYHSKDGWHYRYLKDVNKHIDLILYERGISSRKNITLVGVHVRRGDKLRNKDVNVASQEYLHNAVHYFRKQYGKVLFIVA